MSHTPGKGSIDGTHDSRSRRRGGPRYGARRPWRQPSSSSSAGASGAASGKRRRQHVDDLGRRTAGGARGELAKQWGQENGVTVNVVQVNFDNMKDQFTQQAPTGQGPDIFLGANDWGGDLVKSGLVAPIDLGANKSQFDPTAVNGFTVNGQTYGVPVAVENVILIRNTTLAPNAPTSINDMATTGLALQAAQKTQFPIGMQVGDKGDAYHAYPFYSAAGGYIFGGPDAQGN